MGSILSAICARSASGLALLRVQGRILRISQIRIENFRCVRELDLPLDQTTVLIGANNAGKTAIMEAVRIALTRRWGQRGTGFTEYDVHCAEEVIDPKLAPAVRVLLRFEEDLDEPWDADMVAALEEQVVLTDQGANLISLRVTCAWSEEKDSFDPTWEFLDAAGQPLGQKAQRALIRSSMKHQSPSPRASGLLSAEQRRNRPRSVAE